LLRALGARNRQLRNAIVTEFSIIGLLAGLLAALGTETAIALLHLKALALPASGHPLLWLLTPLAGAALTGVAGYLGTRRVLRHTPLAVLR
jgi:putative ABC transport system permease protein